MIIIVTEFDNPAVWADASPKLQADPAYIAALREVEAMGRELLAVSLETEITP